MKVVLASSSEIAAPIMDELLNSQHDLVCGISMPDKPTGRGQTLQPNEFSLLCKSKNVRLHTPASRKELHELLSAIAPDVVITIAYGRLIKSEELKIPRHGWLNIHFSLLPRWRGAAPVQRTIEHGDSESGISIFRLDEGMDTGPIFYSERIPLIGEETFGSLLSKLSRLAAPATLKVLEMLARGDRPTPQVNSDITLAPKLTKDEARIDWKKGAIEIERQIRAMNPWPVAWTKIDEERISILKSRVSELVGDPGKILSISPLIVGCGESSLMVEIVKPAGKREMSAAEWIRGARLSTESSFV
jgi:methionyl-tRNA formyltransferase